ncbi:MAG TPA: radical SAM protein, partial [Longimicrobiaceae bacterium]|nr:radical SAM protein [Longimicrobiaceae bacterium]
MQTRTELTEGLIARFPHIPREAVFKEDLLRTGMAFDGSALTDNEAGEVKPKSYFIFSFDQKPLKQLGEAALRRPPEEVALTGGPYGLRRTIVSVRVNPDSPYRVTRGPDGGLVLLLEGAPLAEVEEPPMPEYYRHRLANGKSVMEIAPTIQWGYLVYLTVLRLCQYFGAKEECQYCDINHNWRQHKQAGRPYTGVKPVDEVLEALEIIDRYDTAGASHAYTLTGGSVTSQVEGLREAEFYGRYSRAIEERFPGRWIGKVVAQALPKEEARIFKEHGIRIYHPNYEVWDERLFRIISPGKQRYVGREEWHRRILDARDIFGARFVIPNFVAGVEMARPYGFTSIDEAIASTAEGLDFFMSRGVTPRFTTWCPEPTTPLGKANPEGAPLEYHVRLL